MAIMYPDRPKQFDIASGEGLMFEVLSNLPDSYYVFHSFSIVTVKDGTIYESETDFVIYNEEKGILCLEAKNGRVGCSKGYWEYGSGERMKGDGPYRQAAFNKWKLGKYMTEVLELWDLFDRCKMIHAVWFPSVRRTSFRGIQLPAESDLSITLTKESTDDIEKAIAGLFEIELPNKKQNRLTPRDTQILIDKVFAPHFNLVTIAEMKHDHNELVFKAMLKEQVALLNYLDEQNEAVINGMAGTGKTVMAINKALRHANLGERVLFLCYNVKLKEYLQEAYPHELISYYTIDGLACKLCNTNTANYEMLYQTLADMYGGLFPYTHVIIDEGQDFERADEMGIISLLKMNVLDDNNHSGTFYFFYDKNQMIQSNKVPEYIAEADCKLTLYRNCRNSLNIATTSLRLLGTDVKPKLAEGVLEGDPPELYLANDLETTIITLNLIIEKLWECDYQNIQILTCLTEETSIISSECSTGVYAYKKKKIPFTTSRKFKGLEADAVILIDIGQDMLGKDGNQLLYVGASRAKFKLDLICSIDEETCEELLSEMKIKKTKKPGKALAASLNAKYKTID